MKYFKQHDSVNEISGKLIKAFCLLVLVKCTPNLEHMFKLTATLVGNIGKKCSEQWLAG